MAVTIATSHAVPVELSARILKRHLEDPAGSADDDAEAAKRLRLDDVHPRHAVPFHGLLVAKDGSAPRIVEPAEAQADLHMPPHQLSFSVPRSIEPHEAGGRSAQQLLDDLFGYLRECVLRSLARLHSGSRSLRLFYPFSGNLRRWALASTATPAPSASSRSPSRWPPTAGACTRRGAMRMTSWARA